MKTPNKSGLPHLGWKHKAKSQLPDANAQPGTATASAQKSGFHIPFLKAKNATAKGAAATAAATRLGENQNMASDDMQSAIMRTRDEPNKKPLQYVSSRAKNGGAATAKSNKGPFHWPGLKGKPSTGSEESTSMAAAKQKKGWFHMPSL